MDEEQIRRRLRETGEELEGWSRRGFPTDRAIRRGMRSRLLSGPAAVAARVAVAAAVVGLAVQLLPTGSPAPRPAAPPGVLDPTALPAPLDPSTPTPSPSRSATTPTPSPAPSEPVKPSPRQTPPAPGRCRPVPRPTPTPKDVSVTLEVPRAAAASRSPAAMTVRIKNTGATPREMYHGSYHYDVWVTDARGLVWVWSQGFDAWTMELRRDRLLPGEERTGTGTWAEGKVCRKEPLPPGRYIAQAFWYTVDSNVQQHYYWYSNAVPFEIR